MYSFLLAFALFGSPYLMSNYERGVFLGLHTPAYEYLYPAFDDANGERVIRTGKQIGTVVYRDRMFETIRRFDGTRFDRIPFPAHKE